MAKFTTTGRTVRGKTKTLIATVQSANGRTATLEFDGLAWAQLVDKATIEHEVFQQTQLGKPALWSMLTGIHSGHVANRVTGEHSLGLTFLVPNGGVMNFLPPAPIELVLREKLRTPEKPQ